MKTRLYLTCWKNKIYCCCFLVFLENYKKLWKWLIVYFCLQVSFNIIIKPSQTYWHVPKFSNCISGQKKLIRSVIATNEKQFFSDESFNSFTFINDYLAQIVVEGNGLIWMIKNPCRSGNPWEKCQFYILLNNTHHNH